MVQNGEDGSGKGPIEKREWVHYPYQVQREDSACENKDQNIVF